MSRSLLTQEARPAGRIEKNFRAVESRCELTAGEFRWAVMAELEILQDGLTEIEAGTLVKALQKPLTGFRQFRGLLRVEAQQLLRFPKEAA